MDDRLNENIICRTNKYINTACNIWNICRTNEYIDPWLYVSNISGINNVSAMSMPNCWWLSDSPCYKLTYLYAHDQGLTPVCFVWLSSINHIVLFSDLRQLWWGNTNGKCNCSFICHLETHTYVCVYTFVRWGFFLCVNIPNLYSLKKMRL